MRNLFRNYRKKENLKAIADARPKGVHHTVKFASSYNETWEHIWSETKKIGLSEKEDKCFISEERFSYDIKLEAKQNVIERDTDIFSKQIRQCKAVKFEEVLLVPITYNERNEGQRTHNTLNDLCELNYTNTEYDHEEEKLTIGQRKTETIELIQRAEELICVESNQEKENSINTIQLTTPVFSNEEKVLENSEISQDERENGLAREVISASVNAHEDMSYEWQKASNKTSQNVELQKVYEENEFAEINSLLKHKTIHKEDTFRKNKDLRTPKTLIDRSYQNNLVYKQRSQSYSEACNFKDGDEAEKSLIRRAMKLPSLKVY